jgi:hypothetical protein
MSFQMPCAIIRLRAVCESVRDMGVGFRGLSMLRHPVSETLYEPGDHGPRDLQS